MTAEAEITKERDDQAEVNTDDVPLSMSRNIHDGITLSDATISVEPLLTQRENYVIDNKSREAEPATITQDSIRSTVNSDRAGNRAYQNKTYLSNDAIRSRTSGTFAIETAGDTHAPYALCRLKHAVTIEFTDQFNKTHAFRIIKSDKDDAEELKERLTNRMQQGNLDCWYKNGHYYLGDGAPSFRPIIVRGIIAALCGLAYTTLALPSLFALFAALGGAYYGVRTAHLGVGAIQTYRNASYTKTWRCSTTTDDTAVVPDATDARYHTVTITRTRDNEELQLKAEELDATWSFDCEDDILPEEVIDFYEAVGFDKADAPTTKLTATTTKEGHDTYLTSDNGQWYLLPSV